MNPLLAFLIATMFLLLSCQAERPVEANPPSNAGNEQSANNTTAGQAGRVFSGIGVALTPKDYPRHSAKDVRQMFQTGKELGDYAVFIYQWSDPNLVDTAKTMMNTCKDFGCIPIIGLSPTTLGGLRDKLDVPAQVRKKAGARLSFANPEVHLPFIRTALALAKLQPPYLCLATEINLMAFRNIEEYKYVAFVYKKLYHEIKKISPSTKVFVSFQWDFFTILDNKDPRRISEHTKLIDIFRPELDLVAFTSYPADHFSSPTRIPRDYYSRINRHVKKTDEIMFMEIGWPAGSKGAENQQEQFIGLLPVLMKDVRPRIIAWSLLHDVGGTELSSDLAATGLLKKGGEMKTGFKAFRELRRK